MEKDRPAPMVHFGYFGGSVLVIILAFCVEFFSCLSLFCAQMLPMSLYFPFWILLKVALNTITLTLPSILDCPSFFSNVFFFHIPL